jgi:hypothetical protein
MPRRIGSTRRLVEIDVPHPYPGRRIDPKTNAVTGSLDTGWAISAHRSTLLALSG